MTDYYDAVLAAVPVAMVGVPGALWAAGVPPTLGIVVGSAMTLAVICHALFINGPTGPVPEVDDRSTPGHDAGPEAAGGPDPAAD